MNTSLALAAIQEARLQVGTGGDHESIRDALDLAIKVLRGDEISDADLDLLHPSVAHRLRDDGHP